MALEATIGNHKDIQKLQAYAIWVKEEIIRLKYKVHE